MFRASSSLLDRLGECGLCLGYKMKVGLSWGRGKGGGGGIKVESVLRNPSEGGHLG